jgi:thiamine-monophosphate kinase
MSSRTPVPLFTPRRAESIAALGERGLIGAIRRWLGSASPPAPFGIGDDCAVLPRIGGRLLLTVDPVVYGRHFDDSVPARAVGAKLLKRNLSDLAAMGGSPRAAVVALALDPRVRLDWLEGFYRGLAACARRFGVALVGGDIAQADGTLVASLTLLGKAEGPRVLTRTGARAGDSIYVTGALGGSRLSGRHHSFSPRLAEGAWLARQPAVLAMMDLSDGLAKDIHALTPQLGEAAVAPAEIPRNRGVSLAGALGDGEDFELLFALAARADPTAFERAWRRAFPRTRLSRIGRFVRPGAAPPGSLKFSDFHGYEHLR